MKTVLTKMWEVEGASTAGVEEEMGMRKVDEGSCLIPRLRSCCCRPGSVLCSPEDDLSNCESSSGFPKVRCENIAVAEEG